MPPFSPLGSEPIVPLTRTQFDLLMKRGAIARADRLELLDGRLFRGESAVPLSRAQFDLLVTLGAINEDERVELLHGAVVQMSPQDTNHSYCITKLAGILWKHCGSKNEVVVQGPFAASDTSEPEPDLCVAPRRARWSDHPSEALLIVEVAGASLRRDRTIKARIYAAAGVPEYWVVNLREEVVEIFTRPSATGYRKHEVRRRGAQLRPHLLKSVKASVSAILPPGRATR